MPIKMSPRFVLGRENVPRVAEVVNRSLKADYTDFNNHYINPPYWTRGERAFEIRSRKQQIGYVVDENGKAIRLLSLEEKGPVSSQVVV